MVLLCKILLDRPSAGFYRPGDVVAGTVRYAVDKKTKISKASITLKGTGRCEWSAADPDSTGHLGTEEYMDIKKYILHPVLSNIDSIKVRTGSYDYNFTFVLPGEIPSSLKNEYCTIKYQIMIKFKKSGLFHSDAKFDTDIVVREYCIIDPKVPHGPLMYVLQETPFQLFRSNSVNVKAVIWKSIINPGEPAKIDFTVENQTKITITCIKVELKSKTIYKDNAGFTKKDTKILDASTARSTSITKFSNATVTLEIPTSAEIFTVQRSKIFSREYKLIVTLKLPAPSMNSVMKIPIIIGYTF